MLARAIRVALLLAVVAAWTAVAGPAEAQGSGVDLRRRLGDVHVEHTPGGDLVTVPGEAERLRPEEFVARIRDAQVDQERRGFLFVLLNISSPWGFVWVAVGLLGQALFTFRMVLQWVASEKQKRSVVPVGFWWGSLFGGLMLLVYFLWRKDAVGVLGQSTGVFIYARNLVLIYRGSGRPAARSAGIPAWLREAALVGGAVAFALLFQGTRGLWEPLEGRYAGISSQMIRSGNYLVPALNDHLPVLSEPPLTFWSVATGMAILGRNEWGARLASALAFAATILVLGRLGRRVSPARPLLPAIVYATSILPFAAASVITSETLIVLWHAVAILGFAGWMEATTSARRRTSACVLAAGLGLAVLTQGPLGVLPALPILGFLVAARGWRGASELFHPAALAIFGAIGLGWYAIVGFTEHVRPPFLTGIGHADVGERLLALAVLALVGTLPWTPFLLREGLRVHETVLARAWWKRKLAGDPWSAFLIAWTLLSLAALFAAAGSLDGSRLLIHMLPALVPLSLATALALRDRKLHAAPLAVWALALVAGKWAAASYLDDRSVRPTASALEATLDPDPEEVVFVDTPPVWSLGFYLGCKVEPIALGENESRDGVPLESLAFELSESEPGVVLVVDTVEADDARVVMKKLGYAARTLTEIGSWSVLATSADRGTSFAPDSGSQ